jgi:nicotinate-nucleotide pyrophosphorylase
MVSLGGDEECEEALTRHRAAIDIISTSAIHQSTQHVDFSLKLLPASS